MNRIARGTLGGALFGGLVAFAIPALLMLYYLMFVESTVLDRRQDLATFPGILLFSTVCGILLGAMAGFASHLPNQGISFLRCCMVIGIATAVTRVLSAPRPKVTEADQAFLSYSVSLLVALISTGILAAIGYYQSQQPMDTNPTSSNSSRTA